MRLFADLHIHSCLSPCADNQMTPNNIMGMANIKGLNIIAITDHNTTRNLKSFEALQSEYNVLVVPGIEVTSREEVHILGYFLNFDDAIVAGEIFTDSLTKQKNIPDIFGNQIIMDEDDNIIGEEEAFLIRSTSFNIDEVVKIILSNNGIAVPAHVNRGNNGLIINQGIMPISPKFNTIEYSIKLPIDPEVLSNRHLLISSDAHYLGNILEKEFALPKHIKCVETLINWMKSDCE